MLYCTTSLKDLLKTNKQNQQTKALPFFYSVKLGTQEIKGIHFNILLKKLRFLMVNFQNH